MTSKKIRMHELALELGVDHDFDAYSSADLSWDGPFAHFPGAAHNDGPIPEQERWIEATPVIGFEDPEVLRKRHQLEKKRRELEYNERPEVKAMKKARRDADREESQREARRARFWEDRRQARIEAERALEEQRRKDNAERLMKWQRGY